jgi:hypothetical protein
MLISVSITGQCDEWGATTCWNADCTSDGLLAETNYLFPAPNDKYDASGTWRYTLQGSIYIKETGTYTFYVWGWGWCSGCDSPLAWFRLYDRTYWQTNTGKSDWEVTVELQGNTFYPFIIELGRTYYEASLTLK